MKKVYVILIFACVLANAMDRSNDYGNQYNNRIQNPQNNVQENDFNSSEQPLYNRYNNPTTYDRNFQGNQSFDHNKYYDNPYNKYQENLEQNKIGTVFPMGNHNRGLDNEKNEGNGKMMALSFVIGLLVGASAALAWHFATKEVVKAEGEEAESEKAEGEEAKGEDDEEKQCQHAIKENDAVINVQDLKNQNAAEYANQPETTY